MERDTRFTALALYYTNFNSHAHVERDLFLDYLKTIQQISTHTLTWSVTVWNLRITTQLHISTHTLTWSVTPFHI